MTTRAPRDRVRTASSRFGDQVVGSVQSRRFGSLTALSLRRHRAWHRMSMATRTPAGQVLTRLGVALAVVIHLLVLYVPSVPSTVDVAVPGADKAAHVLVFAAVIATGVIARLPAAWLAAVLGAHAGVSEVILEFLLEGRTGDVWARVSDLRRA